MNSRERNKRRKPHRHKKHRERLEAVRERKKQESEFLASRSGKCGNYTPRGGSCRQRSSFPDSLCVHSDLAKTVKDKQTREPRLSDEELAEWLTECGWVCVGPNQDVWVREHWERRKSHSVDMAFFSLHKAAKIQRRFVVES